MGISTARRNVRIGIFMVVVWRCGLGMDKRRRGEGLTIL